VENILVIVEEKLVNRFAIGTVRVLWTHHLCTKPGFTFVELNRFSYAPNPDSLPCNKMTARHMFLYYCCVNLHFRTLCIWTIDGNIVAKINILFPNRCLWVTFTNIGFLIEKAANDLKQYSFYVCTQHIPLLLSIILKWFI